MTDPTQAPINKTLMLKVKSVHNSFHAFHTVLRLQARLNHLEAVTSFSSPEAKTHLDHFQQEYVKLERRAKKIKAESFLQEWVSLRERYVIVDHRAQKISSEKTLRSPTSVRIPLLLSHALCLDIMILLLCTPQLLLHLRPSCPNFHFKCGKMTSRNGELSGGVLCK